MPTESDLELFPRPGVTIDLAVLTVTEATGTTPQLRILIQDRTNPRGQALPGGFMRERWTVRQTVDDVLTRKVGIDPRSATQPRLLRIFDDPERDDRTWALSVAHSVSMREAELDQAIGNLHSVSAEGEVEDAGELLFDHQHIVRTAIESLRERYEFRYRYLNVHPDPDGFLTPPFTLHQLRKVHEAVVGAPLHKDNFNRRMKPFLKPILHQGEPVLASNLRGRPAALYRSAIKPT